jgi:hypothetical protein
VGSASADAPIEDSTKAPALSALVPTPPRQLDMAVALHQLDGTAMTKTAE